MTSANKSTVFRVTGFATTQPDDELDVLLQAAIRTNLLEKEKLEIQVTTSIVPSCYDEQERVALVDFRGGVPKFLSGLAANPLEEWQVELDDDTDISFDRHFFGFTQLFAPRPEVPTAAE